MYKRLLVPFSENNLHFFRKQSKKEISSSVTILLTYLEIIFFLLKELFNFELRWNKLYLSKISQIFSYFLSSMNFWNLL
ncbi:hypothetical protein [Spiroplasma endosymbiont of Dromius quadrimaculatus]|uniref:hypothetical protein n=1 Tax=Spiroplasma endosymbiont of Dromius quadrimaculatus TaxID=3066283 RepID=UPI00313BE9D2